MKRKLSGEPIYKKTCVFLCGFGESITLFIDTGNLSLVIDLETETESRVMFGHSGDSFKYENAKLKFM